MNSSQNRATDFHKRVERLLRAAFESRDEADLVTRLRNDKDLAGEIVLEEKMNLVGYAALSKMASPEGWFCLAPVAVEPEVQGRGHGKALLRLVLKWAAERDATVVVLGNTEFYGEYGFSQARAARLQTRYPVKYTMLAGSGGDAPKETLIYPSAFDDLD